MAENTGISWAHDTWNPWMAMTTVTLRFAAWDNRPIWTRARKVLTDAAEVGGGIVTVREGEETVFAAEFSTKEQAGVFASEVSRVLGIEN